MTKYVGWSLRNRPFSEAQYKKSALGTSKLKLSYSEYLENYARQWKNPKLRKGLK